MTEIVAINHVHLTDPRISPYLQAINQTDLQMLQKFCAFCRDTSAQQLGLMPRIGVNNLPFHNKFIDLVGASAPTYNPLFADSWSDITDARAKEIEQLILSKNKKLGVFWSGGIDSTCILTAILKNFAASSLELVTVLCTSDSVLENPVFYEKHVKSIFSIANANNTALLNSSDFIIVDGSAADTLLMSMSPSFDVCMSVRQGELLSASWRTNPDTLIDYLGKITQSKTFALWYYETNKTSIESTNVPIETYFDFMWWISFNYDYYNWAVHTWFFMLNHIGINWQEYQSRFVGWYRTDLYQLWAMKNNGEGVKHGTTLGSLKHHPKSYIYEYDSNEYYYRYKTKINSLGRIHSPPSLMPFAITDQFEILYLDKDLDQIVKLLPTHIKL
jgi:hypothetical protein